MRAQEITETTDYFRRREREEKIISGLKPARKKQPSQTSDYARRREQERKKEQGVAEGSLNEYRDRMYQYLKSIVPGFPDYVVKDWLYANFARGATQGPGWSFDTIGKDIPKILADMGLSVNTKWQLVPDMKFTMNMWEPKTLKRLQARAGGSSKSTDPDVHIPARDAERHATQAQLAQQQGGVRKEPVILIKTAKGYELLEGWHRTIQHFAKYPDGYIGPAYVAVAQGQQGVAEGVMSDLDQDRQDANWDAIVGYVINGLKKNQDVGHMELALYKWGGKELVDVDQELEDRGFRDLADLASHIQQHGGQYQPPKDFGLDEDRNPVYQLPELTLILDPHFIERMGTRQLNSRVVAQLMSRLKNLTQELSQFEPGQKIWVNSPSLKVKLGMRRQMDRNGKMTYLLKTVVKDPTWDNPDPTVTTENFADGKNPGRKGLSKRVGIPKKATLAQLEKIANSSTGERRRMAQWQLNMRRGKQK